MRINRQFMYSYRSGLLAAFMLLVLLCLNLLCVPRLSGTYDEYWHWLYGRKVLEGDPGRPGPFFDSKMPFSIFNAIPAKIQSIVNRESADGLSPEAFKQGLHEARVATILFSLLLGFYVFKWSKELYGTAAGLLSLFLYAFSPNIIAHSHLVTADLYVTCMITIAIYYFWKFMNSRDWAKASMSAATLGVAQLTKYTAVYLYPIFTLVALLFFIRDLHTERRSISVKVIGSGMRSYLKYSVFFFLINLVVINAGFGFHRSFTLLRNYDFQSSLFQRIQTTGLKYLPVPLPYPYLKGLDMVKDLEERGTTHGNVYLLGKLHTRVDNRIPGFSGYFLYTLLFKEPIATQLLILFAIFCYIKSRSRFDFLRDEIFLVLPVLFFLIYFNFLFSTHIGIRFILVVLPFLYIFSGCQLKFWAGIGIKSRVAYAGLCAYLLVSVLSYFPHYLAYFNELVWNRTKAYKILADSNLDWGQSELYLERYLRSHPDTIINPLEITSGRIVVSANALVGVGVDPEQFAWLRNNFEPTGNIAYSYLVYEIKPESIQNLKEKTSNRTFKKQILDQPR